MNQKSNEFRKLINKLCVYLLAALILIMATAMSILAIVDIPTKLIFSVLGSAAFVYVARKINEIEKRSCFPNNSW